MERPLPDGRPTLALIDIEFSARGAGVIFATVSQHGVLPRSALSQTNTAPLRGTRAVIQGAKHTGDEAKYLHQRSSFVATKTTALQTSRPRLHGAAWLTWGFDMDVHYCNTCRGRNRAMMAIKHGIAAQQRLHHLGLVVELSFVSWRPGEAAGIVIDDENHASAQ